MTRNIRCLPIAMVCYFVPLSIRAETAPYFVYYIFPAGENLAVWHSEDHGLFHGATD